MAQVQQSKTEADPITESFVIDRQTFWTRFTSFATKASIAVALLLAFLWLFIA